MRADPTRAGADVPFPQAHTTNLPHAYIAVYRGLETILLGLGGLGGLVIAIVGALLPANWAAKTRTSTALRTE